ncbi:MAG: DUF6531 domain-containing protein [Candidatus Binataceae bacterium]
MKLSFIAAIATILSAALMPASVLAYVVTGGTPAQFGPAPGGSSTEYSSAVFEYSKTDLSEPGPLPIVITRTYRSEGKNAQGQFNDRGFGLGTTLNYLIVFQRGG